MNVRELEIALVVPDFAADAAEAGMAAEIDGSSAGKLTEVFDERW